MSIISRQPDKGSNFSKQTDQHEKKVPDMKLPKVALIEQVFAREKVGLIEDKIQSLFTNNLSPQSLAGKRIAITVGSRGIENLAVIVKAIIREIQAQKGQAFIIPAMGSHGGGTPEGQLQVLSDYGIRQEDMGVPILSSLETVCMAETEAGVPVYVDKNAYQADGIIVLNRIKPHTLFSGDVESGLLKMIAVGLGKLDGARTFHNLSIKYKHDELIKAIAQPVLASGKIICGIAVIENAYHETSDLVWLNSDEMEMREPDLLLLAKKRMPSLPIEQADVLIIDQIGKDVSGIGIDPNVSGRHYRVNARWQDHPQITRIVVLDLSEKTMGNAVGIGLADFCSQRVVDKMDKPITYLNAVTSGNTICSHIPLHFETDAMMLEYTFLSVGSISPEDIRLLHIRDTLQLTKMEVSEALVPAMKSHPNVKSVSPCYDLPMDGAGNIKKLLL